MRINTLGRSVLALATVLTVAGSGLVLAVIDPTYVPKSSVLLGPATVAPLGTAQYTLRVTFTNGQTADFPPNTGATFAAVNGTINSSGLYTNTSGTKDKVSGSFTQNSVTTTSSRIIRIVAAQ